MLMLSTHGKLRNFLHVILCPLCYSVFSPSAQADILELPPNALFPQPRLSRHGPLGHSRSNLSRMLTAARTSAYRNSNGGSTSSYCRSTRTNVSA